jgi:adenylosuccinate lyase/3-carboxy-cis,cis-muconate cycloisomerase
VPTTLDCAILRDLWGSAKVRAVFESRALVQAWLDVERALAQAEAEVGLIPESAAERIAREAHADLYDLDALRKGIAESQHPLVPLLRSLAERCGEFGGWVHWGATTQDVIDTGLVIQVRAALEPVRRDLSRSRAAAARLAAAYRDTPMAGRTHGQHAVPITFGLKAASWADEIERSERRLDRAARALCVGQLAGAAGTLASLGASAGAVRGRFCRILDLDEAAVPWHVARDRLRDLAHALDEIAAAAERIAVEIVRLQSTEVAEAAEPVASGHVGSSTMPQKRNPMVCEYIAASARLLRASTSALTASAVHAHERDMAAWAVEWLALPQALILGGGIAEKLAFVLEGLALSPDRMRRNLALTQGQIMAEAVMMAIAGRIGHLRAHELVSEACARATEMGLGLGDALLLDPEFAALLGPEDCARLLVPENYLGIAGEAVDAVVSDKPAPRSERSNPL